MISFDEATHTYTVDGVIVPNVTSIMRGIVDYSNIPRHILDEASERGTYVHKCCEMFLWGTLDESSVEPGYMPYLDAFKLFLGDTYFIVEHIEERVYHRKLKYAGTVDMIGIFPPIRTNGNSKRALIDIKTTFKLMKSTGPQTAAYKDAWESAGNDEIDHRYGLQLKKDGTYNLAPMKSPIDMNIFRSCLAIHNYMMEK